jgi:hypothetical protein
MLSHCYGPLGKVCALIFLTGHLVGVFCFIMTCWPPSDRFQLCYIRFLIALRVYSAVFAMFIIQNTKPTSTFSKRIPLL